MKFSEMPYRRVEREDVERGYRAIIERTKQAKSGEEQYAIHREYYRFWGHNQTNLKLAMIRHDLDVTDAYYKAEQVYNDQLQPVIDQLENEYKAVLYHSPYRDVLEKKLGRITFQNMELAMRSYDERVLELRRE